MSQIRNDYQIGTVSRESVLSVQVERRLRDAVTNPAISYISSLASTNSTGGRANARYMIERFCRFLIGHSSLRVDWLMLCKDPELSKRALAGFLTYKTQQKHYLCGSTPDPADELFKQSHLTPIIDSINAIASDFVDDGQLTECEFNALFSGLTKNNLKQSQPLEYGWMQEQPINSQFKLDKHQLSANSLQALESFSSFCITSCLQRFDWSAFLSAPVVKSAMNEYLNNGVVVNNEKLKNFSPATADNLFRMILGVAEHHWLAENLTVERLQRIKAIKLPRGSRATSGRYITFDELDTILAVAGKHPNPIRRVRDQAIFSVLYDCGLRRSELVSLTIGDVNLIDNSLRIIGKGNKERKIYFDAKGAMMRKLEEWLSLRQSRCVTEPLFCGISKSKSLTGKVLTTQTINDLCRWVIMNGFNKVFSPHDFRHSLATNLLSQNHDLLSVSKVLGHSSLSTTQRYDQRGDEMLRVTIINR
ncbi:tyrosine-type recombinase/integrase [Photobacterium sp. BZF1]|uniref:tyrosine-type recombinase/integrase n=1 Tax=Photobacterium sp. BZF1 TaxID=1904457 RepID=UPI001653AE02|nr:tyrosine-type recombinase/integrase [Photobacterium sp. BZF1]MBC7004150.1 tyrosine-type recombinase/integrase [Photobacterium sp. BZF1]